jgi:hypothetical protein
MNTKATASRHLIKHLRLIALAGALLGGFADAVRAECTCSPDCTKCDVCPEQYETPGSCRACYRSTKTNLGTSVMCTFIGTRISAPVWKYLLPDSLPGTRQDTIKQLPFGLPFDLSQQRFVLTMSQPPIRSMTVAPSTTTIEQNEATFVGQVKPRWPKIVGGVLPGTRPDFGQPNLVAILPGTRPSEVRPRFDDQTDASSAVSDNILIGDELADAPKILPGTRPVETVIPPGANAAARAMGFR